MSNQPENISVLIAAAGTSSRMHTSKLFLQGLTGDPFIAELIHAYRSFGVSEIVVVINQNVRQNLQLINDSLRSNVRFVVNDQPDLGRFRSVKLGLAQINKDHGCFFQNIDNPFPGADVLIALINKYSPDTVHIPAFNETNGHPVLLAPGIIKRLLSQTSNDANLRDEIFKNNVQIVHVSNPDILLNLNTPEEYNKYLKRADKTN